jgi:DNA invertase Pin-like site-specific DNA recombinase
MERLAGIKSAALYARVSTKDGRQDTENQLIALREYCAKQGWTIVEEYVDHETGGTSKRPHFQRMFTDAHARKFDLVLFWSPDRFSREGVSATLNHLEKLNSYGVAWRSHTKEYLDSCGVFRDAVLAILAGSLSWRESEGLSALWPQSPGSGATGRRISSAGRGRKPSKRAKAQKLRGQGWSLRDIGAELGRSSSA